MILKKESTLKIARETNYCSVVVWEQVWVRRLVNRDVMSMLWTCLTSADHFYLQVKCQEGMTTSPTPALSHSLSQIQKKSHNKTFSLLFFTYKFPSMEFVRIYFGLYFIGENLFMHLWKLLLCAYSFHFKWVVVK